jgi:hypothetical protein
MFCRTCASPVEDAAEICMACGVRPFAGKKFCQSCGVETPNAGQVICLACGVRLGRPASMGSSDPILQNGDLFYRLAGVLMIVSGLWNAIISLVLFFSLVIMCVGVFWIVPGILALVYAGFGIAMAATGNKVRFSAFLPILGFGISLMNLNFIGIMLDVGALVLGIIGFVQNRDEE